MKTIANLTISWNGTKLKSLKVKDTFRLGESPDCDFPYKEDIALIKRESDTSFCVKDQLLHIGGRVTLPIEGMVFDIVIEKEEKTEYRAQLDKPFLLHVGGIAILSLTFFGLMSSMPPDSLSMSDQFDVNNPQYARFFYQKEVEKEIEEPVSVDISSNETSPSQSSSSKRGQGKIGSGKGIPSPLLSKGPSTSSPSLQRGFDPTLAAQSAGILGVLASQGSFVGSGNPFSIGDNDSEVWGNTTGVVGDDSGLIGSGRFGNGGNGVIGIGKEDFGNASLQVGKNSVGFGTKEKQPPRIEVGPIESSNLDKDMVRRIVRAHINEVRSCYNTALTKNPTLEGRVVVQFTILGTGQVSSSVIQDSSVRDSSLESCISKAVKRWKFPSGKGISIISYPFVLSKG